MRPDTANNRAEPGHWEGDTVRGSKGTAVLVTLVDSRYLLCAKVPNKERSTVRRAVVELLTRSRLPAKSVTFDQGTEFAENTGMEKDLGVDVYYAHPKSPWERPTNENINGLIRPFVPKRRSPADLTEDDVYAIVAKLNFRPRKCLNWKSSYALLLRFRFFSWPPFGQRRCMAQLHFPA